MDKVGSRAGREGRVAMRVGREGGRGRVGREGEGREGLGKGGEGGEGGKGGMGRNSSYMHQDVHINHNSQVPTSLPFSPEAPLIILCYPNHMQISLVPSPTPSFSSLAVQ